MYRDPEAQASLNFEVNKVTKNIDFRIKGLHDLWQALDVIPVENNYRTKKVLKIK